MKAENSADIYAILADKDFVCDTQISYECTCDEETGDPFEEWDPTQCNCKQEFLDLYNSEKWAVCDAGGGSGSGSGGESESESENDSDSDSGSDSGTSRPASMLGAVFTFALWLM